MRYPTQVFTVLSLQLKNLPDVGLTVKTRVLEADCRGESVLTCLTLKVRVVQSRVIITPKVYISGSARKLTRGGSALGSEGSVGVSLHY